MWGKLKPNLFSAFGRVTKFLTGTGIGKIPGVCAIYEFLLEHLWSYETISEIQGSKMWVNPEYLPKSFRRLFLGYIASPVQEELTTELFKKVVKDGDIVVDLGANIGYYTLLAARLVGKKGRVYAFEPEPINYSLLIKNIELNGYDNIVPVQKAISNITGTIRLFLRDKHPDGHTIYQPNEKTGLIEVESVTLDEFFEDKKCSINVIKMDIEGAEMAAFLGMERLLKESENLKMFVEFYPHAIKRSGVSPEDFICMLLKDYGFSILAIGDHTKDKKYLKINNVDELMNFCKGGRSANLFLEKGR
jgi:FkbM family methyltransferase